jgi:hypothetical protein
MVVDRLRGSARHQGLLLGLQVIGGAMGAMLLLLIAGRHNVRFDLTPDRAHTLTDATREVLARLDQDVEITVFYDGQEPARRREAASLLERYREARPGIQVRMYDLDRSPGLAKRLGVSRYNTGVLEGKRRIPLTMIDEKEITSALMYLIDPVERIVYFTVEHGEHDPFDPHERRGYTQIARELEAEHYMVRRLEGLGAHEVPPDATVVVAAGPRTDFEAQELATLRRYVAGGGAVAFLLDPGTPSRLAGFLAEYGLVLGNDVVVSERNALLGADSFMPRIPYINQSAFPRPPDLPLVLAEAQSITLGAERPGITGIYLAYSTEDSWADVGQDSLRGGTPLFSPDQDHRGPVPVAALARVGDESMTQRGGVITIGDADFASNLYLGILGNRDFFLAVIDLLTHRELHGVLRPVQPGGGLSLISLTARQNSLVFWTTVILPPATVLAIGAIAALRRRRRLA